MTLCLRISFESSGSVLQAWPLVLRLLVDCALPSQHLRCAANCSVF